MIALDIILNDVLLNSRYLSTSYLCCNYSDLIGAFPVTGISGAFQKAQTTAVWTVIAG